MQRSNYSPAARKKIACQLRERAAELDDSDVFSNPKSVPQGPPWARKILQAVQPESRA
jgi:hypothetical protein